MEIEEEIQKNTGFRLDLVVDLLCVTYTGLLEVSLKFENYFCGSVDWGLSLIAILLSGMNEDWNLLEIYSPVRSET